MTSPKFDPPICLLAQPKAVKIWIAARNDMADGKFGKFNGSNEQDLHMLIGESLCPSSSLRFLKYMLIITEAVVKAFNKGRDKVGLGDILMEDPIAARDARLIREEMRWANEDMRAVEETWKHDRALRSSSQG